MFGSKSWSLYRQSERKIWHLSIPIVSIAVLGASCWLLGIIFWSHATLQSVSTPNSNPKVVSPHAIAAEPDDAAMLEDLWPDDYEDAEFSASLHACLEDCGTTTATNIGLMFFPGSIGLMFVQFVHSVARSHAAHTLSKVIWTPTFHLPRPASGKKEDQPYSHIIRFANLPLLLSVGDALLYVASPNEVTWKDVQETTKLLLTWHCQLSNLADQKTLPMLTMTMEQIEEDPFEQEMYLREFLPALEPYEDDENTHVDEDELVMSLQEVINRIKVTLKALDKQLGKERKQSLDGMIKHIIQDYFKEDAQCPDGDLYIPSSPVALLVYEFLKVGNHGDDQKLCKDATMSKHLVCKTLTPPFDTKSLIQEAQKLAKVVG